ncbi:hypothetical protein BJ875DRAFT_547112 [Amylocarpus encephaloides]|uniref:Uncharacterized protein n=1 Tax=Amylocarpus encephaloides TaxID=45428 RepID=A0A9P7Y8V2_9HELO|nr:hypothetical protein BJ875DRAFT_547112 [Amylocarpus encephaloides]
MPLSIEQLRTLYVVPITVNKSTTITIQQLEFQSKPALSARILLRPILCLGPRLPRHDSPSNHNIPSRQTTACSLHLKVPEISHQLVGFLSMVKFFGTDHQHLTSDRYIGFEEAICLSKREWRLLRRSLPLYTASSPLHRFVLPSRRRPRGQRVLRKGVPDSSYRKPKHLHLHHLSPVTPLSAPSPGTWRPRKPLAVEVAFGISPRRRSSPQAQDICMIPTCHAWSPYFKSMPRMHLHWANPSNITYTYKRSVRNSKRKTLI